MTPKDATEIRNLVDRIASEPDRYVASGWDPGIVAAALFTASFRVLERTYGRAAALQVLRDHLAVLE